MSGAIKVERIRDGKTYPTVYRAAMDNYCDPCTMSDWVKKGTEFRRAELTEAEIEQRAARRAEKRREYQRRYYKEHPEQAARYKRCREKKLREQKGKVSE